MTWTVAAADRIETRRKQKVGSKTTVSLGASAEQVSGGGVAAAGDAAAGRAEAYAKRTRPAHLRRQR